MHWLPTETKRRPAEWLQTARGQALAVAERRQLQSVMPGLIGYRRLHVGPWNVDSAVRDAAPMCSAWRLSAPGERAGDVWFDGLHLPFMSGCIDTLILTHALEYCASPRRLLREVDRVLCDRGQVVLFGFNPWHPAALARRATMSWHGSSTGRRSYTAGRVRDWLDLLDFEIIRATRYGAGFPYLPVDGVDWRRPGRWWLPATFAQAYLLVARKRIMQATLMRRPHRARSRARSAAIPATAPRIDLFSEAA